jgi:hypothetical protein
MTKPVAVGLLAALSIAFAWGVLSVFHARFEAGGIYPAFSSLRKEPDGTSVLFESILRLMPATERNYAPLETVQWSGRTLLLIGAHPGDLVQGAALDRRVLETLARKANRIVLAFTQRSWADTTVVDDIEKAWGVTIQKAGTKEAPEIDFSVKPEWEVLQGTRGHADVIGRVFGAGSLVLLASSEEFQNGRLANQPDADLLTSIIGPTNRVVFDEAHLGILETGSVMGLVRTYRLQGVLIGVLVPFALFVWKCSTSFPQPSPGRAGPRIEGRRSFSGLVALLRRNVRPKDLAGTCWEEWLKGAARPIPAHRRTRVEQSLSETGAQPLFALKNIHEILSRKGTD